VNGPRVRLAIGAVTPATRRAIDAAIRLARASGGQVDCLFVEEVDLFDAAALPITREMCAVTTAPRRFDAQALAGALRRQAEQARREVSEAGRRSHVATTFDVTRGRLLREPIERAGARDLIVIGVEGYEVSPVEPGPGRERAGERLLAVVESLPDALALLRAALGAMPGALPEVWSRSPAAGSALEQVLRTLEIELGRPLRRVAPERGDGEPSVADVVVQVRPRVLAIDRESLESAPPELIRALRRLGVTVLAAPSAG
jgi:hypothetical protein